MAGPSRPEGGSPLDKLSRDVTQYQRRHAAGPQPVHRPAASAPSGGGAKGPGWTELDSNLSSQILVGTLITGYAILMLSATLGVLVMQPSVAIALWPVMAIGVLAAMIAYHKGRPPLLWFMYGSVLPMGPVGHAVLAGKAGAALGDLQGLLGGAGGQSSGGSVMDLLVCVCALGAIPLVHAALAPQNEAVREARQLAAGMKKCPSCAEMVKPDAKVCRWCRAVIEAETAAGR